MLNNKIKNVLYFAENAISNIQGGGIVVEAVLKGLPKDKILGFFEYRNITPSPEYADRFIYLGQKKIPKFFNFFFKNFYQIFFIEQIVKNDLNFAVKKIEEENFEPEIVYFSGLSLRYLMLAVFASKKYKIPMILLHMDDWMAREEHQIGIWGKFWYNKILKYMKIAASKSLASTTNSSALADKITKLTGYTHKPANNCNKDLLRGDSSKIKPLTENQIPIITYAGSMNQMLQGETLEVIASAVSELNSEGFSLHLHIYTPWQFAPKANLISVPDAVFYKGHISKEKLSDVYLNSDFLLTTVTFNPVNLLLFKNSLSTKLSEYLCVGKPVISAGHPDWHLNNYVEKNNCGFAIKMDENYKRAKIKEQIKEIILTDKEKLKEISKNSRLLWEKAHDVRKMSLETRLAIGLEPLEG
ncbi:MAG: hypothetical protein PHV68_02135 [Candidatus Gastranaerophilales bacterium]|nr:hypothetical protein [Candidatus Gastranaerophilales bacterium]